MCYLVQVISAVAVVAILAMSAIRLGDLLGDCAVSPDGLYVGIAGAFSALCASMCFTDSGGISARWRKITGAEADSTDGESSGCWCLMAIPFGVGMGFACGLTSVVSVFAFISSAFHPSVIALMAGVFVGRDLLFVAEHIEGTPTLSITRRAPIGRAIGAIASVVCLAYAGWVSACLLAFFGSGAFFYCFVFLPMPLLLAIIFFAMSALLFKAITIGAKRSDKFKNAKAMFVYESDGQTNPYTRIFAAMFLAAPLVAFGTLLSMAVFADLTTAGSTGSWIKVLYDFVFDFLAPPYNFSVPDLNLSELSKIKMPSMGWDMRSYIQVTAGFFSLTAVASLLKTMATFVAYSKNLISVCTAKAGGKDKTVGVLGMAAGRNALQGFGVVALANPLHEKAVRLRATTEGGIEMCGVVGGETRQKGIVTNIKDRDRNAEQQRKEQAEHDQNVAKQRAAEKQATDKQAKEKHAKDKARRQEFDTNKCTPGTTDCALSLGLKFPQQTHSGKWVSSRLHVLS
jgi:hypothetical protein